MTKYSRLILSLFFSLTLAFVSIAQEENPFVKPKKQTLVVDYANMFSNAQEAALQKKLTQFNRETSTQILIYTTPDLKGYDVADFAQRLGAGWGVGQGKFDNGVVIVFKPKVGNQPGKITLQTGYGIEPLIPDAIANRIINNEMIPAFKQGNVYGGIDAAVDVCISLTKEEFTAQAYADKTESNGGGNIIFLIVFGIALFSMFGKSRSSRYYGSGSRSNLGLFAAMMMMGGGSHRGSGFDSFSSGSGSFGGGGGGFGGFGGGGFGGGGASGSW